MKKAEYPGNVGCPQRDSAEHEEYAGARSIGRQETEETDGADLLEQILSRDNLNRAYKRVKANKGAPGVDGMTVEDALPWLRKHREELLDQIRSGKYKPQPVRRKEIPKPDGGVRKLGIPTVVDRIIQRELFGPDGLHPNAAGAKRIAEAVFRTLSKSSAQGGKP